MKHATAPALTKLEPLLVRLRPLDGLKEKSRGVFYRKSRAVLHFHEDPAGLFADFRPAAEWDRFPVNTEAERKALLKAVQAFVSS